jgi:hypothetical protein
MHIYERKRNRSGDDANEAYVSKKKNVFMIDASARREVARIKQVIDRGNQGDLFILDRGRSHQVKRGLHQVDRLPISPNKTGWPAL